MSTKDKLVSASRPAVYLTGGAAVLAPVLVTIASVLGMIGWGTYDAATRTFDPPPISIDLLLAGVPAVVAPFLALVAWFKGWGR